jgi:SAM-dependent methyltransferase
MAAFDPLAPTYDDTFSHTTIGRYLRARVQVRLAAHFHAGDHVLELGCGTGEDALYLAQRGVYVTATDVSAAMLDITRAKAQGNARVRVVKLDLKALTPQPPLPQGEGETNSAGGRRGYDGAFANFGPVNVLDDWRPLAAWLAAQVRPGGLVGLGVMGPLCLWEIGWHALHRDFKTARRRLHGSAVFQAVGSGEPLAVHYPSIRRLERDFAPHFRRVHLEAVGLFLPPSDVFGVVEKRPCLLRTLMALEDRCARYPAMARFADHYWIEFEKRA